MASETLRFDITGNSSSASRAFKETAEGAAVASRAAKELDKQLRTEIKTAEVAAAASREAAEAEKLHAEAMLLLYGGAEEASRQLKQQGRAAEESAAKTRLAGEAAKGAGGGFSALASPMGAAIGAGVALAPIAVTVAAGLGGLGLAALSASKDTKAMAGILGPLKGELAQFDASLKPEVLTLFGDGAGIATRVLRGLQPVAAATGKALHGALGQVDAEFASKTWQDFFAFMERTAGPDVQQLGALFTNLAADIPPLLETLQPVASGLIKITTAVAGLPAALDQVKQKTGANQPGFFGGTGLDRIREFFTWGEKHIPAGNKSISDLIGLTGRAASGTAGTAAGITATGTAAAAAAPAVGTLSGDIAILATTTSLSTLALQALGDEWGKFIGNTVGDQQAVLSVTAAFESFNSAVKQGGRTSTAAQQAFLSIFTTIGSGLDTLEKNGASVSQLNSFYQTSIDRLNALHGLTPAQRADVQGLTRDYLAWASSVAGLSGNTVKAAGVIRDDFLVQMAATHRLVPQAKADSDAFAAAVLKTGTNSRATASDRARLISDLVHSGLSAQDATALVKGFQDKISALKGKTVSVGVTASGSGGIDVSATGLAARIFKLSHLAAGGRIPGFGGGDVHPALLEGGETVVDKHTSRSLAGVFKAAGVPGYAGGGIAGMVPFTAGQVASDVSGWAGSEVQSMVNSMIAAYRKTLGFLGAGSGNYAADIQAVLSSMGLPLSLTANWLRQIQTESGGNLNAVNLTDSNARAGHPSVGLLQLIPGTFQAYAGPYRNTPPLVNFGGGFVSENPMAQIYAAIHYAAARYGGAGMAGVIGQGHGYDSGGFLPTGWSMAWNGTGRPEPVIPAGRGSGVIRLEISGGASEFDQFMMRWFKEKVRVHGGRNNPNSVQLAFGN